MLLMKFAELWFGHYQNDDGNEVLDSFQPDEQLKKKKRILKSEQGGMYIRPWDLGVKLMQPLFWHLEACLQPQTKAQRSILIAKMFQEVKGYSFWLKRLNFFHLSLKF
ncbi:hypothetical protein SLE2022_226480 [Rubroshorea leprosula]